MSGGRGSGDAIEFIEAQWPIWLGAPATYLLTEATFAALSIALQLTRAQMFL